MGVPEEAEDGKRGMGAPELLLQVVVVPFDEGREPVGVARLEVDPLAYHAFHEGVDGEDEDAGVGGLEGGKAVEPLGVGRVAVNRWSGN